MVAKVEISDRMNIRLNPKYLQTMDNQLYFFNRSTTIFEKRVKPQARKKSTHPYDNKGLI